MRASVALVCHAVFAYPLRLGPPVGAHAAEVRSRIPGMAGEAQASAGAASSRPTFRPDMKIHAGMKCIYTPVNQPRLILVLVSTRSSNSTNGQRSESFPAVR